MSNDVKRFSVCSFACAFGLWWGLSVLILGLMAWLGNWGTPVVELLASVYIGFGASFGGIIIGVLWAVVDGFIAGLILAWLYNLCLKCPCPFKSKCDGDKSE